MGKTSLANMLKGLFADHVKLVVKVNCDQDDSFGKVWQKACAEVEVVENKSNFGFMPRMRPESRSLADDLPPDPGPDAIRRILQHVGTTIVIFDEFDRLQDARTPRLFADTIKNLSDNSVDVTIVLVGVADDVDDLIKEHASVDRALVQIQMPRMHATELEEIVNKALGVLGVKIEQKALDLIVVLSQGLPHYTHLLGLHSTRAALSASRKRVTLDDVHKGIESALEQIQQSIRNAYQKATASQRKDTIFRQVLLACALADVDELGYFVSADVREPLSEIMGKRYEIPGFSQHLNRFAESVQDQCSKRPARHAGSGFAFAIRCCSRLSLCEACQKAC
ncbi:MAG: ATP-binding protein [Planctomycetes bacterium]|nr:ATP-binding protein [Planctomycetota bacterium]